jgi:hypothetical protein
MSLKRLKSHSKCAFRTSNLARSGPAGQLGAAAPRPPRGFPAGRAVSAEKVPAKASPGGSWQWVSVPSVTVPHVRAKR